MNSKVLRFTARLGGRICPNCGVETDNENVIYCPLDFKTEMERKRGLSQEDIVGYRRKATQAVLIYEANQRIVEIGGILEFSKIHLVDPTESLNLHPAEVDFLLWIRGIANHYQGRFQINSRGSSIKFPLTEEKSRPLAKGQANYVGELCFVLKEKGFYSELKYWDSIPE